MRLEQVEHVRQFAIHIRHRFLHRKRPRVGPLARRSRQILRGADPGDNVLALRVNQIFAVIGALTCGRIARERDARCRRVTHVAEYHRLHVDGSAPVTGDRIDPAVNFRSFRLPRTEHRTDCAPKLVIHVLREGLAPQRLDETQILANEPLPVFSFHVSIKEIALVFLGDLQRFLKRAVIEPEHDIGVHLNEAPIAVPCEPGITANRGQPLDSRVIDPKIEDGVHHAGHRHASARPDRYQQRIGGIAKPLFGHAFDVCDPGGNFGGELGREPLVLVIIARAHGRADCEPRRHRQPDRGHPVEIGSFAAQQFLRQAFAV